MAERHTEIVTPAKARKWLEKNTDNRPARDKWIRQLAEAMSAGEWQMNGETIKFDVNGTLRDGQHRLEAVILSGKNIPMMVVRGLAEDVFTTIDQGRPRRIGDEFARRGEPNYTCLAGAVAWLWRYEVDPQFKCVNTRPANQQAADVLARHPEIRDSVVFGRTCGKILAPTLSAFGHYLFSRIDEQHTDKFFASLVSGENLRKSQAVYRLRERLMQQKAARAKLDSRVILALLFKSFNSSRNGDNVGTLKWTRDESFPVLKP